MIRQQSILRFRNTIFLVFVRFTMDFCCCLSMRKMRPSTAGKNEATKIEKKINIESVDERIYKFIKTTTNTTVFYAWCLQNQRQTKSLCDYIFLSVIQTANTYFIFRWWCCWTGTLFVITFVLDATHFHLTATWIPKGERKKLRAVCYGAVNLICIVTPTTK